MHPPRRLRTLGGTNNTTPNGMKRRLFCFACLLSATASAHYGNSEFEMGTQQRVAGTLTDIVWRNPHIILTLATTHDEGRAISLEIEAASPNILRVGRFSKDSLHVGEQVTALVSPSLRFPDEAANGYEIVKADGSVVPLVSARLRRPALTITATAISGSWVASAELFTTSCAPCVTGL